MNHDSPVRLVLVTGPGRSGTSTVAGTLKRLGLHIPQPELPPDDTNPRGFHEPQWVVDFHKALLGSIPVRTQDARPQARALAAQAAGDPRIENTLREWLSEQLNEPQIVIKDPRVFWVHELWLKVANDLGVELSFLSMLRHPIEVARSRDSAYLTEQTPEFRRTREIANVAGWCNGAFETEYASRPAKRAFVCYTDLVANWRQTMARAGEQLGISYNADLSINQPHAVDDFVDTRLYRTRVNWRDSDVPERLRIDAERVWGLMNRLVESPYDVTAIDELTEMQKDYARTYEYAEALALDHTNAQIAIVRRRLRARLEAEHNAELKRLRRQLVRTRRRKRELEMRLDRVPNTTTEPKQSFSRRLAMRMRTLWS